MGQYCKPVSLDRLFVNAVCVLLSPDNLWEDSRIVWAIRLHRDIYKFYRTIKIKFKF